MSYFPINSNVKKYIIISWIIGILGTMLFYIGGSEAILLVLFILNLMNVAVNFLVIIQVIVLFFVFKEKRIEFFNSMILLFFNFPFMVWIFIYAILEN